MTSLFGIRKVLIGVVHLAPLPGSPRWRDDMAHVLARAREDAAALEQGGADAIIVENFGDAPFSAEPVGPHTVAAMALAVMAVRERVSVPVGVNMLRNDPYSAIAVAAVTGARFVRANVHYGVMVADEGLIEGQAHDTLRYRRHLGVEERVQMLADVLVKHAVPMGKQDIVRTARETAYRGLADAIIVTGPATGQAAEIDDVKAVKGAVPDRPVLVGSGIDEENVDAFLALADGAIVGSSLKIDGVIDNPVDEARVGRLARHFKASP